jgi:hypothetical protein
VAENACVIFIRPAKLDGGPEKLLTDLGYEKPVRINVTPYYGAGGGSVWIATTGDCVIIHTAFAGQFFGGDDTEEFEAFRTALLRHFSETEVTALSLVGVVAGWGFAVFRHGNLVRRQYGVDGTILHDEGEPLPLERAFLARFERSEADGETHYRDISNPASGELTKADMGYDFVKETFQSFTGLPFDKIPCDGVNFWLSEAEQAQHSRRLAAAENRRSSARRPPRGQRPWWKFWR